MQGQVPTVIIIILSLTINLHMASYSGTLAQHLGAASFWARALVTYSTLDHSSALKDAKYQVDPPMLLLKN